MEEDKEESKEEPIEVAIRWMTRSDIASVLEIESAAFEFPWVEKDIVNHLRMRNCIAMVAEHEERILGYMFYELHKTKLTLINLAVAPTVMRRGIGSQLMTKLCSKLSPTRRTKIELAVRETNLAAQLFFGKHCGFQAKSIERNYYDDTDEAAYIMEYDVKELAASYAPANRIGHLFV